MNVKSTDYSKKKKKRKKKRKQKLSYFCMTSLAYFPCWGNATINNMHQTSEKSNKATIITQLKRFFLWSMTWNST